MKINTKELVAFMAPYDHDELPDGAWFAMLEDGAREYLKKHPKLRREYDENDLAHLYLEHCNDVK